MLHFYESGSTETELLGFREIAPLPCILLVSLRETFLENVIAGLSVLTSIG